jgi:hypothetical protein
VGSGVSEEEMTSRERPIHARHRIAWQWAVVAIAMLGIAPSAVRSQSAAPMASPSELPASSEQPGYWCPMHPNLRGAAGDKCPLCGMALVPIAPGDYQPYGLDFEVMPRTLRAHQQGRIRFYARDPHTRAVVRRFDLMHERVFHLFVVSRDFEYFAHLHPTLHDDGSLDVGVELPRPGVYQLIADFVPAGAPPQLVQKSFATAGYEGLLLAVPHLARDDSDKVIGETRVKLIMPEPLAGREQLVTFEFSDAATGAPATDLQPYLGAAGHLLLASADLAIAAHSHPVAEMSAPGGPDVVFQLLFPRAGEYRMWVQVQRHGEVLTASFTVPVKGRY